MNKLFLIFTVSASIQWAMASDCESYNPGDFTPHMDQVVDPSTQVALQITHEAQHLLDRGIDQLIQNIPAARNFLNHVETNIQNLNTTEAVNKVAEVVRQLGDCAERIAASPEVEALINQAANILEKINGQFDQTREDLRPALENLRTEVKRLEDQSKAYWEKLKPAVRNLEEEAKKTAVQVKKAADEVGKLFKKIRF